MKYNTLDQKRQLQKIYHTAIRATWHKACLWDQVDPKNFAVVFSENNPYTDRLSIHQINYKRAMEIVDDNIRTEARRALLNARAVRRMKNAKT